MFHKISGIGVIALLITFCATGKGQTTSGHLWVGITVNHALYSDDAMNTMIIEFAVFNDGKEPTSIDACIDQSTLLINGSKLSATDLGRFAFYLNNGPRSVGPLLAGKGTGIVRSGFGDFFSKPGIYNVVWKSNCFESAPISFRVTPRDR